MIFPDNRTLSIILGGVIVFFIVFLSNLISFLIHYCQNKKQATAKVAVDLSEPSFCSTRSCLILCFPRGGVGELIFVAVLAAMYGAGMTYFIHESTILKITNVVDKKTKYSL